jgi:hypothetical protein
MRVLLQDLGGLSADVRHLLGWESLPAFVFRSSGSGTPPTIPAIDPYPAPGLSFVPTRRTCC